MSNRGKSQKVHLSSSALSLSQPACGVTPRPWTKVTLALADVTCERSGCASRARLGNWAKAAGGR